LTFLSKQPQFLRLLEFPAKSPGHFRRPERPNGPFFVRNRAIDADKI
jgi:hypothetical protein